MNFVHSWSGLLYELSWIGCCRLWVVVNAAALVRCVTTLRTCDNRPWERFFYLFSKYKRIYFIILDNINDMTFQMRLKWQKHIHIFNYLIKIITRDQARAEGGAEGAWAPAPLPHDAQSALLSRQFFYLFYFIKHPSVKACPI